MPHLRCLRRSTAYAPAADRPTTPRCGRAFCEHTNASLCALLSTVCLPASCFGDGLLPRARRCCPSRRPCGQPGHPRRPFNENPRPSIRQAAPCATRCGRMGTRLCCTCRNVTATWPFPTDSLRRCLRDGDPLEGMSTTDSARLFESLAGEFLARACDLVRVARTQPLHDAPVNRLFNIETRSVGNQTVSSESEVVGPQAVTIDVVREDVLNASERSEAAAGAPGGTLLERWTWAHEVGVEPQSRSPQESCRSRSLEVPLLYKRAVRLAACGLGLRAALGNRKPTLADAVVCRSSRCARCTVSCGHSPRIATRFASKTQANARQTAAGSD
jgi:hypothetical protein